MIYIRNDDVAYSTELENLKRFCGICDQYPVKIIHGITPMGDLRPLYKDSVAKLKNWELEGLLGTKPFFAKNKGVIDYLKGRDDVIAVHGFNHLHPPHTGIAIAQEILENTFQRTVNYFIPPFNEMDDLARSLCKGLRLIVLDGRGPHLEEIILGRETIPADPDGQYFRCHSWRFGERFTWDQLDDVLESITSAVT